MAENWAVEGGARARAAALGVFAAAALLLAVLGRSPAADLSLPFSDRGGEVAAERAYGELPLAFERDAGRSGAEVDFLAHTPAGTTLIGSDGATLMLGEEDKAEALRLELANGAGTTDPRALERLPGEVNYLVGERSRWKTGIGTYERVRYLNVYPGVSLDWYGNQRQLEYDFRLAPDADPGRIAFRIGGAEHLRLASNGDLLIDTGRATVRQRAPVAYQTIAGERHPVESSFALRDRTVGFELGAYDRTRPLVIDPLVLAYSTYLGGNNSDLSTGIAIDSSGAAYVTGFTSSTDYCTGAGCSIEGDSTGDDAYVSKLNPAGDALAYSTYLGGDLEERALGIAVDSSGAAFVTGFTLSTDYCTGAGCSIEGDPADDTYDAFVSKLTPAGDALAYSTYLGGDGIDIGRGIEIDSAGAAYVTGDTSSSDYCTGPGCSIEGDPGDDNSDAFVSKLNPAGTALAYSTYLGGDSYDVGHAIAVDSGGAAFITGQTESTDYCTGGGCSIETDQTGPDAFVSKVAADGTTLTYSTYLGGNIDDPTVLGPGAHDSGIEIAVDGAGATYVIGSTESTDFNTVDPIEGNEGGFDAFVSKLASTGTTLTYSTYLGGNDRDFAGAIAVDSLGAAYVTGSTLSTDFNTVGELEGDSGGTDAFVSKLTPAGNALAYSTYLGGSDSDGGGGIAVDDPGAAYITGSTGSTDWCTGAGCSLEEDSSGSDAFVAKLRLDPDPGPAPAARSISLDASKRKVTKGKKVRLSGQIDATTNESGCEASQTVELQRVKKGSAFKTFTTDQTDAAGDFAKKVKVKRTFRYRAELDETAACEDAVSNTKKVKAKPKKRKRRN